MNTAARGDDYDQRWLAANRREINEMLASFNQMRENLEEARPANMQQDFQNMHHQFADAERVYQAGTSVAASAALRAAVYGGLTLAAGGTATGISAFSFFGGP
jgi:hypothetical protein